MDHPGEGRGSSRAPSPSGAGPRGIVCACFRLTGERLRDLARRHGLRTVEDVAALTGACRGCRTCQPDVEAILRSADSPAAG